jgi:phospholipase C
MFRGTLSLIEPPSPPTLKSYTSRVMANTPSSELQPDEEGTPSNPVPRRIGNPSPIKYVFYVIKENRTYDQVFGDIPEGNGDSSLCLFPAKITPNLHALARRFVLLDNLYADAEVSADGHNWSMGGYATDYVEKTWPTVYGNHGGEYEYEGGTDAVYPDAGYIWDDCARQGVSYRSYGEFVLNGEHLSDSSVAAVPSLRGHVAPHSRGWDLDYSDTSRIRDWMEEFDRFDKKGGLPQFQIIKLPNDHTAGTRRGSPTPRAYVAQNDLAVGLLVERISRSRYWKESAIFVIEDDAQNGPDHVDAHRTEALVISPWTKSGYVDRRMYSTCSMLRTMELILGLPPMSQFDAAARPMYDSFDEAPHDEPYVHLQPNIDLGEKNRSGAFGQRESEDMDFSAEDETPQGALNEIIWKSIRGARSVMPPPVRAGFVEAAR